jgi:hypothetical protein
MINRPSGRDRVNARYAEVTPERMNSRNGNRSRQLDTASCDATPLTTASPKPG